MKLQHRGGEHFDLHTPTGRLALRGGPKAACQNFFVRDERAEPSAVFDGEFPTKDIALSVMVAEAVRYLPE